MQCVKNDSGSDGETCNGTCGGDGPKPAEKIAEAKADGFESAGGTEDKNGDRGSSDGPDQFLQRMRGPEDEKHHDIDERYFADIALTGAETVRKAVFGSGDSLG